jgi:hypothetical protein
MFGPIVRVCKSINKRRMYGRSSEFLRSFGAKCKWYKWIFARE